MYDTAVNVERTTKENNEFYNEQWGRAVGTSVEIKAICKHIRGHGKIFLVTITQIIVSVSAHALREYAMLVGNQGIMPASAANVKQCFHCGSHLHQMKDCLLPP